MKAIINEKLYDTETAEKIYSFRRQVNKGQPLWARGLYYTPWHDFNLYRTKKGAYFEHDTEDNTIEVISEESAMAIIKKLNPDKFCEIFNQTVEEG